MRSRSTSCLVVCAAAWAAASAAAEPSRAGSSLVALFTEWREAQRPPVVDGVPDYTPAALARQRTKLDALRARLDAIDAKALAPAERIDRELVLAEMNGLDFDLRVLQPWSRNPAFYANAIAEQSDTPAHEGRTIEGAIELWQLRLPLSEADQRALALRLRAIPRLLAQARANLTGDARDLWLAGIRSERQQADVLRAFADTLRPHHAALVPDVDAARAAVDEFRAWLERELPGKHGPSGVGRDNYDWYLKNVYRVPYTWQDELRLMERELQRSTAHLALEEHRNRALPPLEPAANAAAWQRRADESLAYYARFLREQEILSPRDYYEPALRARLGSFVPPEKRDFFTEVDVREPLLLRSHGNHWLDLARMEKEPQAEPDPARPAALQHLGPPRGGRRDRDGGADDERRPLRRAAAQPRARLRDDRAARGPRDLGAAHALERVDDRAGDARRERAHPARLAQARRRARLVRAAALPGAARLRLELPAGQGAIRGAARRASQSTRDKVPAEHVHGRAERGRHDPALARPRGAHKGHRTAPVSRRPRDNIVCWPHAHFWQMTAWIASGSASTGSSTSSAAGPWARCTRRSTRS
jgi:hypothetical protein